MRGRWNRRWTARTGSWWALTAILALLITGCSSGGEEAVTVTVEAPPSGVSVTAPGLPGTTAAQPSQAGDGVPSTSSNGVRITANPRFGAKDVPPNDPVVITVFSATIQNMTMTADDGTSVNGTLAADKKSWSTAERLNYNTKYTVKGTATATIGGTAVPITGAFSTVNPEKTMGVQINIPENATVGIAAPIIVTFLGQVSDRAAAEKALTVTTSAGDKVQGNWAWVQDEDFQSLGFKQSQVHWRPTKSSVGGTPYWPAGTKVTLKADLHGVDYGNGLWGRDDLTQSFSIRKDALVVKADASSHRLIVMVNDMVVKNYPVSYGKESVPGRATVTGIHVVTNKYPEYSMCNPEYDYCNAEEKWAVRINNNGEFIHENLLAKAAFGIANVSHGCINMGEPAAQEFYGMAKYGDPVEVVNTGGPPMSEADALYDWIYTAEEWKAMSMLG